MRVVDRVYNLRLRAGAFREIRLTPLPRASLAPLYFLSWMDARRSKKRAPMTFCGVWPLPLQLISRSPIGWGGRGAAAPTANHCRPSLCPAKPEVFSGTSENLFTADRVDHDRNVQMGQDHRARARRRALWSVATSCGRRQPPGQIVGRRHEPAEHGRSDAIPRYHARHPGEIYTRGQLLCRGRGGPRACLIN
jgi:hypothetical protein